MQTKSLQHTSTYITVKTHIQPYLHSIHTWTKSNNLMLNLEKTYILFTAYFVEYNIGFGLHIDNTTFIIFYKFTTITLTIRQPKPLKLYPPWIVHVYSHYNVITVFCIGIFDDFLMGCSFDCVRKSGRECSRVCPFWLFHCASEKGYFYG